MLHSYLGSHQPLQPLGVVEHLITGPDGQYLDIDTSALCDIMQYAPPRAVFGCLLLHPTLGQAGDPGWSQNRDCKNLKRINTKQGFYIYYKISGLIWVFK